MSWCNPVQIQPIWCPLGLMNLDVHFSPQIWGVFSHHCFKCTFCSFHFMFSFWNSRNVNNVSFHVNHNFHRPSWFHFFFNFCSSNWVICSVLFSRSLILSSVWSSLLLKLSIKFFSSVIVFFNFRISSGFFARLFCFSFLDSCYFLVKLLFWLMHCFLNFV